MKKKAEAWAHKTLGIPAPACTKYPGCGTVDGSCGKSHLKDGHKRCGYQRIKKALPGDLPLPKDLPMPKPRPMPKF